MIVLGRELCSRQSLIESRVISGSSEWDRQPRARACVQCVIRGTVKNVMPRRYAMQRERDSTKTEDTVSSPTVAYNRVPHIARRIRSRVLYNATFRLDHLA